MDLKGTFGLITAKDRIEIKTAAAASKAKAAKKQNVFGENSDSEPDEDTDWVKKTMKKQSYGSVQQKQSAQAIKKALVDDPTVYQYDELYDEMEEKRVNIKETQKKDRKPKYIENLLKTAEKRKQEDEARQERQVQKEREAEGDMYKDKDAFVTSAYRKKMEELEKAKEEEARKDALDSLVDVTKQKDLSGFYRHLYRQQLEEPEAKAQQEAAEKAKSQEALAETQVKIEPKETGHTPKSPERETILKIKPDPEKKSNHRRSKSMSKSRTRSRSPNRERRSNRDLDDRRRRQDRDGSRSRRDRDRDHDRRVDRYSDRERDRRQDRRSDRDYTRNQSRDRHRDRDSRHHRNRSRSHDRKYEKERDRDHEGRRDRDKNRRERDRDTPELPEPKSKVKEEKDKTEVPEIKEEGLGIENKVPKTRASIWSKRTVGPAFDEALARYFARKQANTLQASLAPN